MPPPYRPDLLMMPIPLKLSFHSLIEKVYAFVPASFLNVSNSVRLKRDYADIPISPEIQQYHDF